MRSPLQPLCSARAGCLDHGYIQGQRFYNLFGQPVPVLCHPHRKRKRRKTRVFSCVQMEFPALHLSSLTLVLSQDATESERSLAPCSSFTPIRCLCTLVISPLCLLVFRLKCSSCLSLFSYKTCSSPLTILVESAAQSQSPLYFLYSEILM